ncbi:ATP-dependent DNA helicase RecQ-like [Pecten maximus]|uniref:ATP-dependent DNA helicase RecQ-like n=2 Tax=Pecten maximus TaxID=6579 RepID=UPI001458B0BD|nr:ATP-dependent DNA helicase RecQ-like [Pecten maximus]
MVSEWGEEFRPAFQKLGELMCILEKALHLILTATATPKSIASLSKQLNLKNPLVISENVDRPKIFIDIRTRLPNFHKFDKFDDLIQPVATELLEKGVHFPVTIMYVESLEALSYFYQFLSYKLKGASYDGEEIPQNRIYAQYHKDYAESMKKITIQELTKETPKVRLVLATVALGMGLNAPSVSRIIHCRPPTTLEKYLQEIGRAGRVGQPSVAILYYNKNYIAKNRIGMTEEMRKFCESETCYRIILVNYFGFESVVFSGPKEHCCSICGRKDYGDI